MIHQPCIEKYLNDILDITKYCKTTHEDHLDNKTTIAMSHFIVLHYFHPHSHPTPTKKGDQPLSRPLLSSLKGGLTRGVLL